MVLLVAATSLALTAPAATAHTEVTSTTPKAGSYAKRSLSTVRVNFNQPIRSGELRVLRAGKKVSTGSGRRSARNVRAIETKIEQELAGGTYVARWTMTAVDGHTQRGSWRFKVRPKPVSAPIEEQATSTPTSTPTATATPSPSAAPETTVQPASAADEGGGTGVYVVGAVLLALFAVGGVVAARRRD